MCVRQTASRRLPSGELSKYNPQGVGQGALSGGRGCPSEDGLGTGCVVKRRHDTQKHDER